MTCVPCVTFPKLLPTFFSKVGSSLPSSIFNNCRPLTRTIILLHTLACIHRTWHEHLFSWLVHHHSQLHMIEPLEGQSPSLFVACDGANYNALLDRWLFCRRSAMFRHQHRADARFAPSQWETTLLCNHVSHWLDANLESALSAA